MEEKEEIWRDIKGFEGLYQISNLGRVKSVGRVIMRVSSYYTVREKILRVGIDKNGYNRVVLCSAKTLKTFLVHRLVAEAFLPNPNNLLFINHKDENPSNNNVENLEWCSHLYNMNYGNRNNKIKQRLTGRIFTEQHKKHLRKPKNIKINREEILYENKD